MTTTDQHLINGRQHARNGEYATAIREFDLLLASDQTQVDGLYYRGCAKLQLQQYQSAIDDFDSAISSQRLSSEHQLQALFKRGYVHYKRNQFDLALDDYRQFLTKCEEDNRGDLKHRGFFGIGCIHATLNQHQQAIECFGDAIGSSRDHNEDGQKLYYLHRGRAFACCAKYNEAKADLNLVIEQSDDSFIKGCAYNELGQHQDAIQQFNCLLENRSQTTAKIFSSADIFEENARFRRGLSHASLNAHREALEDYQYILERSKEPTSLSIIDRIFFRQGMSNMALNDTHKAFINFNKSISINDQQSDVFYARGMLHSTLGRHDAAVHDHHQAMQLSGLHPMSSSIYKTLYYTHQHGNDTIIRNIYQNKLNAAQKALGECKQNGLHEVECHRCVAEALQQLAPYTHDPQATHQKARPHIEAALKLAPKPQTCDIMINAIHQLREAQILCEKYPGGIASKRIVEQFISLTATGATQMSRALQHCSTSQDWKDLFDTFTDLLAKSRSGPYNLFNFFSV